MQLRRQATIDTLVSEKPRLAEKGAYKKTAAREGFAAVFLMRAQAARGGGRAYGSPVFEQQDAGNFAVAAAREVDLRARATTMNDIADALFGGKTRLRDQNAMR
jgi:hypothetical protein